MTLFQPDDQSDETQDLYKPSTVCNRRPCLVFPAIACVCHDFVIQPFAGPNSPPHVQNQAAALQADLNECQGFHCAWIFEAPSSFRVNSSRRTHSLMCHPVLGHQAGTALAGLNMLGSGVYCMCAYVLQVRHQAAAVPADSERSDLDEPQPDLTAGEPGVCDRSLPAPACVPVPTDGLPPHGPHRQGRQQVALPLCPFPEQ